MTPRRHSAGSYGYTVALERRGRARIFYLRFWDPGKRGGRGGFARRSLGHSDEKLAKAQARQLAGELMVATQAARSGELTVDLVFARYERDVVEPGIVKNAPVFRRRMRMWSAYLGGDRDVRTVDRPALDRFVSLRRAGKITAPLPSAANPNRYPGLKADVKGRTIGADIEMLRAVFNWATTVSLADGRPLLERNPIHGYSVPTTAAPKRPRVSFDRFLALRPKCEAAHPRFGVFMDLVEGLGWRVTALCELRADDLDRRATPSTPHGRIRKRRETDKEGVDQWVPLTKALRASLDTIPVLGGPLFQASRNPARAWSRHYAKSLLRRAEKAAQLEPIDGGDFHPYRRKWATERKHHPDVDVAAAGGWKDTRSLQTAYQGEDVETMLAVLNEPMKLREAK